MTTEQRIPRLEEIVGEIRESLTRIETKMDTQFERLQSRMDEQSERLQSRMDTQFRWVLGVTITMWATTMLAVLSTLAAIVTRQ